MRQIIPNFLWIGNALDARDISGVLRQGIIAVVDLAMEEPPVPYPRDVVYCRFPLIDGSGNQLGVLRAAIETTRVLIESQTSLLVACGAGMSRSPAIVAAAMAMIDGITLAEALGKMVAQQPHDVSPSLLGEISEIVAGDFGADGEESDRGSQP
jgi:protein-tyrosine phosphatase